MQFLTVKLFSAVGSPWATGLSGHIHLLCVHPPWVAVNIYCGGVSLTGSREYLFGSWSTSSLSFSAPGASPAASYSLSSPLLSFCHFLTFLNYFFFFSQRSYQLGWGAQLCQGCWSWLCPVQDSPWSLLKEATPATCPRIPGQEHPISEKLWRYIWVCPVAGI